MSETEANVASFEMTVAPDARLVATARRFIGHLCGRAIGDAEITSRILVATHELFENAMRHRAEAACQWRLEVRRQGPAVAVRIETRNRVRDDRRAALTLFFEEMLASADRAAFYRRLVDRVAGGADGVGLGLGRVHAEADFDLTTRFEDDDVLIEAHARFPLEVR